MQFFQWIWSQVTDPFWFLLLAGAAIAAGLSAASYFAGPIPYLGPFLRGLTGAVIFLMAAALFGYREGEIEGEKRAAPKPNHKPTERPWWPMPWDQWK